jgi:hydroxyacid-oxoacid transhydrogenase
MWALESLRLVAEYLPRVYPDANDDEARGRMLLASSYAGIGFGNAGVHLSHAMAYLVAGRVRNYTPPGYVTDHSMVPHGTSVIVHTPAVCRLTAESNPERHLMAAKALGAETNGVHLDDAGEVLAARVLHFMKLTKQPMGIEPLGYTADDIPALVDGTLVQQRLLKLSPITVNRDELTQLFRDSLNLA